jgi:hypothetical protein
MIESLPVLGQFSHVYFGNVGSEAGTAGKTLMEFFGSKNFFFALGYVPGT